ncbi:Similar to Ttc8: Tetratricopeptide repeat protein 8 (Mus musculus) [Cotesia congregata]|uniref:Similar to Ttc8: Tetratricopeptide repeat protein 8 (Mus musculus) n=1 Tax=Cotesia congregata TaxID=51543 RepID=A0A8J2HKX3_COTCN|nr:Similar to Ttc8: Tetratricopeptide repeat protein 8 (Mus musculus) [Cotesia congregata]
MELFNAISLFNRRKYEECASICTNLLRKKPLDQAVWVLKMRALTLQLYVDDIEGEEEGIAESLLDNYTIASMPRPGTSLKNPGTSMVGQGIRPKTQSGRPVTGTIRPMTQSATAKTVEQALRTPRTAMTARPITTSSGRAVRLGTASMLSEPNGPFIQISRLNISKYASKSGIAKPLFEYIFYHEHDARNALDLAVQAIQASNFKDWWWKVQLGKCYYTLGLVRDAEEQFKSALKEHKNIDIVTRLIRVFIRLDQPLAALDLCKRGLEYFPNDVTILTEMARVFEGLNSTTMSVKYYKMVAQEDAANSEAIASIGMHHFYNDQPELGLRYYRRLLQMGVYNAELLNNLGLCCFYAQQWDHTISCFERALSLATNENAADIWYNISHIAIVRGDYVLAEECLRLAISIDNRHASSYNNLGVLEIKKGNVTAARTYFHAAASIVDYMHEPHFNSAYLAHQIGDLQTSYLAVQKSLYAYPSHLDTKLLFEQFQHHFFYD